MSSGSFEFAWVPLDRLVIVGFIRKLTHARRGVDWFVGMSNQAHIKDDGYIRVPFLRSLKSPGSLGLALVHSGALGSWGTFGFAWIHSGVLWGLVLFIRVCVSSLERLGVVKLLQVAWVHSSATRCG